MEMLGAFKEMMGRCFPLYLINLAAIWFRQLENGSIIIWTVLVDRFLRQFRVHISRTKNAMTLSRIKQRPGETLRSYLTRFNAAVDKTDPSIILMAAMSKVVGKTDFKIALERDQPMDLVEFYHEAERCLRQEDAEADNVDINVIDGRGPHGAGCGKDKGKRKA